MDVAIFGAGVAGLMTAITLRTHGHRCQIYERLQTSHEAGMGFILVPAGIDSLQKLGVQLTGDSSGTRLDRYHCRNSAGTILYQQAMPAGALGIRRRDLITALVKALPLDGNLVFDAELSSLEFDDSNSVVAAHLNRGESVAAELYVGADGIHSLARRALFPNWTAPHARVAEVVGLVRCIEAIRWAENNFNKFHAEGGGIAVGVLPVDREHLVWFVQFDAQRFSPPQENAEARRAFVQNLIGRWAEPIPNLLARTDFSRVHLWRPVDTDLIPHFNRGNLVLVGDAAHPLLPFTSQGVSAAVGDAVALAACIRANKNLRQALAEYSIERQQQCAPYIARGRELMQHFLRPLGKESMLLPIA